jgi:hypothetical protein
VVEIFKTNVTQPEAAEKIVSELKRALPLAKINFDLDDCDKVLRVEIDSESLIHSIVQHLHSAGYWCELLK